MSLRFLTIFIFAGLLLAGGGYAVFQRTGTPQGIKAKSAIPVVDFQTAADQFRGFSVLADAPLVPAIQMQDSAGSDYTFEDFRGKVVVFNLWATWCPPCIREMPDLNALQIDYAERDLVVVPVASGQQGREEPAEFLQKRDLLALKTYYDPGSSFLRVFDLETLPTTFVIDRKGRMRGGVIGMADWHSDRAKAVVEALLNEPS